MSLALGWSLLHFLWQGALAGALLASANILLRRSSPQARYLAAATTMLVLLGLPLVTFAVLRGRVEAASGSAASAWLGADSNVGTGSPMAHAERTAIEPTALLTSLRPRIEPLLPGVVALWGAGVLFLSVRGLAGWAVVRRLRRSGLTAPPVAVAAMLLRLTAALRVRMSVRLYESALVRVPTALGWLRPVILLPASAVTGLAPEQIELVLAHELAHIRRRDYVVNLLQTVVETLLFYHPAVWWVSHRMRVEREHCCDDLAVAASGGGALRYARALASLESLCSTIRPSGRLAMAATGGSLFARIARIVSPEEPASAVSRGAAGVMALAWLGLALGAGAFWPHAAGAYVLASAADAAQEAARAPAAAAAPPAARAVRAVRAETAAGPSEAPKPARAATRAAAEARPDPRAFPLAQILEMAHAGVTPEYIDEMDALGYSALSSAELVMLRQQGVGPDYIRGLAEAGYRGLSADQLVSLRQQGVSPSFVRELKDQGLAELTLAELVELRAQGVSAEFVAEWKQAGYDHDQLSVQKLIALRSQGVSGGYALAFKGLGYDKLSMSKLIALRNQGVSAEYAKELADLGYKRLDIALLLGLRSQGVGPEFVRGMKDAGYEGLSAGTLIELRQHGVTPEFVREVKEAGFDKLKPEELIELRDQGVGGELLRRLRGRK